MTSQDRVYFTDSARVTDSEGEMFLVTDYNAIVQEYVRAVTGGNEPNMLVCRQIRRTKAVRRKVGRVLRRGQVRKGQGFWIWMHKDSGVVVV